MFLALGGEQKVGVERLSYLSAYGFALTLPVSERICCKELEFSPEL